MNFSSLEYEDQEQKKRTPEETKKGLSLCYADVCDCSECPYFNMEDCDKKLASDVLMLFQQLEAAQPKWISVENELPKQWRENDEGRTLINYQIYSPEYGVDVGNYLEPAGVWVIMGLPVKVTHWMPLPEPPKEEA